MSVLSTSSTSWYPGNLAPANHYADTLRLTQFSKVGWAIRHSWKTNKLWLGGRFMSAIGKAARSNTADKSQKFQLRSNEPLALFCYFPSLNRCNLSVSGWLAACRNGFGTRPLAKLRLSTGWLCQSRVAYMTWVSPPQDHWWIGRSPLEPHFGGIHILTGLTDKRNGREHKWNGSNPAPSPLGSLIRSGLNTPFKRRPRSICIGDSREMSDFKTHSNMEFCLPSSLTPFPTWKKNVLDRSVLC